MRRLGPFWYELHDAIRALLLDSIRHKLPQANDFVVRKLSRSIEFSLPAPLLWQQRQRADVRERLSRIYYGCQSRYDNKRGVVVAGFAENRVVIAFECNVIDTSWYWHGLRLSQAWEYICSLPERIAALERDLRSRAERETP